MRRALNWRLLACDPRHLLPPHKADKLTEEGVTERYWKLVELNGKPVSALQREPFFILKVDGGTVTGFGGCNSLSGSYEINEATSRIRFEKMASTMMACAAGMDVETAFHQMLRTVEIIR